jgi:glycosyltransferase involved in cell wall biosynthesis
MLRLALFTDAYSANAGGGVLYFCGLAQAMRDFGDVNLQFERDVTARELVDFCGFDLAGVSVGRQRRRRWFGIDQIRRERGYDVIVRQSTVIPRPTFCRRAALVIYFPFQKEMSWRERQYLKSYSTVVAISRFTAHWVARRWGRESTIIYPPILQVPGRKKEPWIVAVGRFNRGSRGKHQLEMVHGFRRLVNGGLDGWELHLCGGLDDQAYLDDVRAAASGLPVRIHVALPRQELDEVLGRASIFWHATGIDHSEEANPELMEHFGMSAAEAMSAGCVPVVVGRGGLTEVVGPDLLEWTWQSWDECVAKTLALTANPELRSALAGKARRQAASFAFPSFQERVGAMVRDLGRG